MIRIIPWWLLLILYRSATWLGHQTTIWQKLLRSTLLPYAVKHYHPRWPETAKPVKRWQERLKESQEAGNPIAPVNHRRPLPDECHCPSCGAPGDYLYNFGYSQGRSGDEDFHKIRCRIWPLGCRLALQLLLSDSGHVYMDNACSCICIHQSLCVL